MRLLRCINELSTKGLSDSSSPFLDFTYKYINTRKRLNALLTLTVFRIDDLHVSFPTFDHLSFLDATQSTFLLSLNLFTFDDYVILYIIIGIDCTMKY